MVHKYKIIQTLVFSNFIYRFKYMINELTPIQIIMTKIPSRMKGWHDWNNLNITRDYLFNEFKGSKVVNSVGVFINFKWIRLKKNVCIYIYIYIYILLNFN